MQYCNRRVSPNGWEVGETLIREKPGSGTKAALPPTRERVAGSTKGGRLKTATKYPVPSQSTGLWKEAAAGGRGQTENKESLM